MKKVLFRADSSLTIGHGHVMRCLSLAKILVKYGFDVRFITKDWDGSAHKIITNAGFECSIFNQVDKSYISENEYENWLGDDEITDAKEMLSCLNSKFELLILDHYGINKRFEEYVAPHFENILVIDDLDREHSCSVILDATIGKTKENYSSSKYNKIFTGSNYCLLREEFLLLREKAFKKRLNDKGKKVLVTMGGADVGRYTFPVVDNLSSDLDVTVVMNEKCLDFEKVSSLCKKKNFSLKSNINFMAKEILDADLGIGAAGTSAYERAFLGLPSFIIKTAQNQRDNCNGFIKNDLARCIENVKKDEIGGELKNFIKEISSPNKYHEISMNNFSEVSGLGLYKALEEIFKIECFELISATESDIEEVFEWQTFPGARKYSRDKKAPSWEEHKKWFLSSLKNKNRNMFTLRVAKNIPLGFVRVDFGEDISEVSIIISHGYYGQGLGKIALNLLRNKVEGDLYAFIDEENIPSKKIFEKCGYKMIKPNWYINKG
ncbi:MAG: UDP-2,4-diacetamido-2,4,6-trideoxy-beta-L-altropyranose hydrolase [Halobacteriovoraceae bacterium]|nr:UDP-2,4-diacetamido-2,4,6-trideoxy-beta-L-altropyranose hydrolase [Halobacteriovoraceae bacterium]|tara:strand:- start:8613 stop:10091 length:1479 start_codon:yes stop_codon:yes gene_type:complete